MKKNKYLYKCLYILIIILLMTQFVMADDWYSKERGYYKVYDSDSNEILFMTAREVSKDDQYLSGDNKMYKITKVNKKSHIAYAAFVEDILLPEIDEEIFNSIRLTLERGSNLGAILAQAAEDDKSKRKVGLYATHSSESYVPSDGSESTDANGGIFKVADKLRAGFEANGVNAIFDKTPHDPHDAGAYKRSRRTALQLMREEQPTALIDVHRDAIPAEEYLVEIKGEPASKVRLVVGRRNQNFKANEDMAQQVKAVADKMYPGLIKDIFYAKGDYNQDLTPRAMLTEMGTYLHTRERAERSAGYLSEVITTALFGGTFKDEKAATTKGKDKIDKVNPPQSGSRSSKGSGAGILGILGVAVLGGVGFFFLSSGEREWKSKLSNFKQEFTNFLGRQNDKK